MGMRVCVLRTFGVNQFSTREYEQPLFIQYPFPIKASNVCMAVIKSERKHFFPDQVFLKRRNRPFGGFAAATAVNLLHTYTLPSFCCSK